MREAAAFACALAILLLVIGGFALLSVWMLAGIPPFLIGYWWLHTWDERDSARAVRQRRRP